MSPAQQTITESLDIHLRQSAECTSKDAKEPPYLGFSYIGGNSVIIQSHVVESQPRASQSFEIFDKRSRARQ